MIIKVKLHMSEELQWRLERWTGRRPKCEEQKKNEVWSGRNRKCNTKI